MAVELVHTFSLLHDDIIVVDDVLGIWGDPAVTGKPETPVHRRAVAIGRRHGVQVKPG